MYTHPEPGGALRSACCITSLERLRHSECLQAVPETPNDAECLRALREHARGQATSATVPGDSGVEVDASQLLVVRRSRFFAVCLRACDCSGPAQLCARVRPRRQGASSPTVPGHAEPSGAEVDASFWWCVVFAFCCCLRATRTRRGASTSDVDPDVRIRAGGSVS